MSVFCSPVLEPCEHCDCSFVPADLAAHLMSDEHITKFPQLIGDIVRDTTLDVMTRMKRLSVASNVLHVRLEFVGDLKSPAYGRLRYVFPEA